MSFDSEVTAARAVLAAHITALNARDEAALVSTLHFPHFRLSGADLKTWDNPDQYFADFRARAGAAWARSDVEDVRVLSASSNKVHFDVRVDRYDKAGAVISSFRSLWVITLEGGIWAAKFRSSFAVA